MKKLKTLFYDKTITNLKHSTVVELYTLH